MENKLNLKQRLTIVGIILLVIVALVLAADKFAMISEDNINDSVYNETNVSVVIPEQENKTEEINVTESGIDNVSIIINDNTSISE